MMPRHLLTALVAVTIALSLAVETQAGSPPSPSPSSPEILDPNFIYLDPCFGGIACVSGQTVGIRLNDALFFAAGLVALAIFLVGAFMMVISAGSDQLLQNAKRAMKYSLIGLSLIVGSYGIYRTVVFLLY